MISLVQFVKESIKKQYFKLWIRDRLVKGIDKNIFSSQLQNKVASFEYYNRYKNIVTTMLRRAKENYFRDKFNDDPRKIVRLLNNLS